jgi:hypothetical protein
MQPNSVVVIVRIIAHIPRLICLMVESTGSLTPSLVSVPPTHRRSVFTLETTQSAKASVKQADFNEYTPTYLGFVNENATTRPTCPLENATLQHVNKSHCPYVSATKGAMIDR